MSTQNPFQAAMADITAQVQAEGESIMSGQPPAAPTAPAAVPATSTPADPAPKAEVAVVPDNGTVGGKFKSQDEAVKAHHLLIHGMNGLKAENDRLKAQLAAAVVTPSVPALSPGRVDPTTATRAPDDEKWKDQYGIDPADLDARIDARAREIREQENAPVRAMQQADLYMAKQYPEFPTKIEDVKAFVQATPALDARVGALYGQGLYAEAMEIAWLAYDNALRTVNLATELNNATTQKIDAQRADGAMIVSQAGGSRDPQPQIGVFRGTAEDMAHVAKLRAAGKDDAARAFIYGPMIAGIPALNGGQR